MYFLDYDASSDDNQLPDLIPADPEEDVADDNMSEDIGGELIF